jgi:predicted metalloprotease with PDZ domain
MDAREKTGDRLDLSFSLGIIISKDGAVIDAIPGSPAYAAGVGPGMKVIGVNGRKYSKDVLRTALHASLTNQQPITLLVENADYYSTFQVDYHGGNRYPHLVRNEDQPNLLDEIIQPISQK